jgi:hypothetical protein
MADVVNLRKARKQAKRRQDALQADANRLAYGQPRAERTLEAARQSKVSRDLDQHRIEKGGGR